MMGLGLAAVFGVLEATVLAAFLSVIEPVGRNEQRLVFPVLGVAWLVAAVLTLVLPAYSADRPLALDLTAHYDIDAHRAQLVATDPAGALPKPIRDQLDEPPIAAIPGIKAKLANMALPFEARPYAVATVTREPAPGSSTTLAIELKAPGAQQIRLRIPEDARPASLQYGNAPALEMRKAVAGYYIFDCVGRSCDGGVVHLKLAAPFANPPATQAPWMVQGYWKGLPPEGQSVAALRTDAAVPIQSGDLTMTTKRFVP
jgi:hypothetical protein